MLAISVEEVNLIVWCCLVCLLKRRWSSKEKRVRQKRLLTSTKVSFGRWWNRFDQEWICRRLLCRPSFLSHDHILTSFQITIFISTFSQSMFAVLWSSSFVSQCCKIWSFCIHNNCTCTMHILVFASTKLFLNPLIQFYFNNVTNLY